tara:strand:+ start:43190 stop:44605 length:1416 start_codon:yes stop_codon:yes gene_type:complete
MENNPLPNKHHNKSFYVDQLLIEKIEHVKIDSLKAYRGHARKHPKKQLKALERGIATFGFTVPVLLGVDGEVVTGHARVLVAKQMGYTKVPAIRLTHLSSAQIRAFRLADNKLAELGEWDEEKLALELRDLIEIDFDIDLTGFEAAEVDLIIDSQFSPVGVTPADDVPVVTDEPVSRPGDLWMLDAHRVLCGDARDPEAYATLLREELAQMVISDSPYNVRVQGNVCGSGTIKHGEFVMASGEMSDEEFQGFLEAFIRNLLQSTAPGSLHFLFMDWRHLRVLQEVCDREYGPQVNLCVWVKSNGGMGSLYRSRHELVVVYKNGTAPHINNVQLGRFGRNRTNVWEYEGVNSLSPERRADLALHPTVKPVAMIADAIRDASNRGDLVLDPFLGSGTAVIACEQTGRICAGMELDPKYVDVIVRRWEAFTGGEARHSGGEARHSGTGLTFKEMSDHRSGKVLMLPAPSKGGEA